jgi:hypothetical protein
MVLALRGLLLRLISLSLILRSSGAVFVAMADIAVGAGGSVWFVVHVMRAKACFEFSFHFLY